MTEVTPLSDATKVRKSTRIAARVVGDRAIVIVIDDNQLHTLNPTGTLLWEQCDGRTLGELVAWLRERFGLGEQQARDDVFAFVRELAGLQALELEGGE